MLSTAISDSANRSGIPVPPDQLASLERTGNSTANGGRPAAICHCDDAEHTMRYLVTAAARYGIVSLALHGFPCCPARYKQDGEA